MTARTLWVRVPGRPAGKGSLTRMPNGAMLTGKTPGQRDAYESWSHAVRSFCSKEWGERPPIVGPVAVELYFHMHRPASRKHDVWHAVTPDLDKLVRCIGDELTQANVLADDKLIASLKSEKLYAGATGFVGADIIVRELAA